jgi:hypothetical protein
MQSPTEFGRLNWEKFTKTMLTTTCLGVAASGVAQATTIIVVEGTSPAPADFPNSSPGYLLPAGTNAVRGQINGNTDTDYFEFQDLAPGTTFSVFGYYNPLGQEKQSSYVVYNSSNTYLVGSTLEAIRGPVDGTVPSDGRLIVEVGGIVGSPTYEIDLSAQVQAAPEPAGAAGAGLALAGILAWKRKRESQA